MAKTSSAKKSKKAKGGEVPPLPDVDIEIVGASSDPNVLNGLNPLDGAIEIPAEDGSADIIIDFAPQPPPQSTKFNDNLAEYLDYGTLSGIASQLLDAIDEDERDRSDWITQRAEGIDLLGLKLERPGGSVGASSAPLDGMSRVRDPILLDSVLNGQATAYAELCPSEGPCKVVNYGDETAENDKLCEDLEKDFNYFFTATASEYYPDTRNMLGMTVYASGMFKKVYWHPLLKRPISESVDGADLIIPSNVTDLKNAGRITHQIDMRQSVMRLMQLKGIYRDVSLLPPTPAPNELQQKTADVAGLSAKSQRPEDQTYTVYESSCELDIPGFEHKEEGESEPSGLPLPYRVTLDKDSRTVLEIRRNWDEDDPDYQAKIPFVSYAYITAGFAGIYGIGKLHILGNVTAALTAMLREGIDTGMFANFPGGLIAKGATRQLSNEIRVAPGTLAPIDISGAQGGRIQDAIMALPYKDITQGLLALMTMMRQVGEKVGGSAEIPVGEGVQNAPVGSVLAMIEQATKVEGSVHKSFHAAQAEEFRLFKELFKQDPESLWRDNRRPAFGLAKTDAEKQARIERFKQALENCEIVPASDPNVPSHIHRVAKANTLLQTAMQMPQVFDLQQVITRWAAMVKIDDIQSTFAPPQAAPPPDPKTIAAMLAAQAKMLDSQTKQGQLQLTAQKNQDQAALGKAQLQSKESVESLKIAHQAVSGQPQADPNQARLLNLKQQQLNQSGQKMVLDAHNAQSDRNSREAVEALKIAQTVGVHPESDGIVDQQLQQMSPLIAPAKGNTNGMAKGGEVDGIQSGTDPTTTELYQRALAEIAEALVRMHKQKQKSEQPPFSYTVN